jgi:hypothetical protein
MAGRPKKIRSIQSYINHIDNNTFSGPMKMGTSPSIGVTHYYWHNYQTQCNQKPNAVKKSYANMVFLNVNSAQTPVPAGFTPSVNKNYGYDPRFNSWNPLLYGGSRTKEIPYGYATPRNINLAL